MRWTAMHSPPRRVAHLLSASSSAVALTATEFAGVARGRADASAVREAAGRADRACRDAARAAGEMVGGGLDRSDILRIVTALRLLLARLGEAAGEPPVTRQDRQPALAAVVRDLVRELNGAIADLDGRTGVRDAHLDRADTLYEEGRRRLRSARGELLTGGAEPVAAIAGHALLRRVDRALLAARQVTRAVRYVVIKHA